MALTLTAVAEPDHTPPRVRLEAEEDDPSRQIDSCAFFRDGLALRFSATITDQLALAYDYDAPFDVSMAYRADVVETGLTEAWAEAWANLGDWLSPPAVAAAGWSVAAGVASSTTPGAIIYRDAGGTIAKVVVTAPSNMTLQLTDAANTVLGSVSMTAAGNVLVVGSAASTVAGSGSYTVTIAGASMAVAGTGWSTSVAYTGAATRVRLVAPGAFSFVSKFGTNGTGDGQLSSPTNIAIDSAGNKYVTDSNNHRVQKFSPAGVYTSQFGSFGSGDGQFNFPSGIVIDGAGNIYVVDSNNHRVQKFNSSGVYQSQFGGAELDYPYDIAIDSAGNFYVTDVDDECVSKFNSSGVFQFDFGGAEFGDGSPDHIAIDTSDNVWVGNGSWRTVEKYNTAGVHQATVGSDGTGNGQFKKVDGIATDAAGYLYVIDRSLCRVQKFNSAGVYESQFGSSGSADGQFNVPAGIVVDTAGDLYVVDKLNHRVQKLTQDGGSTEDVVTTIASDALAASASDTETLAGVGVWLTNTVNPDLALQIDDCDDSSIEFALGEETRKTTRHASTSVALDIEGSNTTLTVNTGPRKAAEWTLEIICKTEAARDALDALLADNAPIALRIAADHANRGLDAGFYAVGDYSSDRPRGPLVDQETSVPLPLTPAFAPAFDSLWQWNWDALAQTGMTWDEVAAAFPTWNDLLIGPVA